MSDAVYIALIVNIGAVLVALVNRGGWKRCETKLDALAKHFGVKFDEAGKVIAIKQSASDYAKNA